MRCDTFTACPPPSASRPPGRPTDSSHPHRRRLREDVSQAPQAIFRRYHPVSAIMLPGSGVKEITKDGHSTGLPLPMGSPGKRDVSSLSQVYLRESVVKVFDRRTLARASILGRSPHRTGRFHAMVGTVEGRPTHPKLGGGWSGRRSRGQSREQSREHPFFQE